MTQSELTRNRLLDALPSSERQELLGAAKRVRLPLGKVLHQPGAQQTHVWFPTEGVISLLYELADGDTAEVGIIGRDGMLGLAVLFGQGHSPHHAVVQAAGSALQMEAQALRVLFEDSEDMRQIMFRYSHALSIQIGQTAVCNRHHRVEQQFCRWILMSVDRLTGDQVAMTQELIANMLGVRRAGVTEVAGRLRDEGIISYQRGRIQVLDRARLEERCCECYQVVQAEYERLLPARTGSG